MKIKNDGGLAFPRKLDLRTPSLTAKEIKELVIDHGGMSLRDYFAAKAMQSILSSVTYGDTQEDRFVDKVAIASYTYAEAMLKERDK